MTKAQRVQIDGAFVLTAAILCFSRFRLGLQPLQSYDDDFYYYLRTAINLVQTGRSTFDGVHLTNGYHPLWFLVIAAIHKITPAFFFVGLQCTEFALACATYLLFRRIFLRQTARRALACESALLVATLAASLARSGMEIGLLFPVLAAALAYRLRPAFQWTNHQAAVYGLLLSLVILARLDAVVLVVLMLAAEIRWSRPRLRARWATLASISSGAALFPAYLLSNHHFFHVWLPISGEAKQLRLHYGPSFEPLRTTFATLSPVLLGLVWGAIALTMLSLYALRRRSFANIETRISLALLIFPFVHLAIVSLRSDWIIWPWYLYPFVLVYAAAAIVLLPHASARQESVFGRTRWLFASAFLAYATLVTRVSPAARFTYSENAELAAWMQHHPGVYAMGDVSGMLSYMTSQRMVQVEGLMEDRDYLLAIQQQQPLAKVLRRYGVTYYIAGHEAPEDHCLVAAEPAQAGPKSPHMYAQLCAKDGLLPPDPERHHQIYLLTQVRTIPVPSSRH